MTRSSRITATSFHLARKALTLTVLSILSAPVSAEDAREDRAKTLDSVKVLTTKQAKAEASTALRLPLTTRQTPQSISVIDRSQLDDFSLTGLDEVLDHATGITVGKYDSQRTTFSARGFTISNFQIDGVPQGIKAPLTDTIFYDHIEILRGANGLMGGTGDPSATVNMIRKKPLHDFGMSGQFQVGRWNQRRMEADVSVPLTSDGRVRSRVIGAWQDHDSYMHRYEQESRMFMAAVETDLTPNTVANLTFDSQNDIPTGATWGSIPYWNQDGSLAKLPRSFSMPTKWSTWRNKQNTWTATLTHDFDNGWHARVSASRIESTNNILVGNATGGYLNPETGEGMSILTGGWGPTTAINRNLDLYLTGPFQFFGRTHTFIAGWNGWFQESKTVGGKLNEEISKQPVDYRTWRSWPGEVPMPVFVTDGSHQQTHTQLGGGYLALRLSIADPLHVIAGARISNYRTWQRAYDTRGVYTGTSDRFEVRREITPYFGATYDFSTHWSAYASYTDLFKPQSYRDRNNQYLEPVTGSNLEGGVKAAYRDGRINVSAALFRTTQKNVAKPDSGVSPNFVLPDGDKPYIANGNGIVARGIELEAAGWLTPTWSLHAGYTFLQAKERDGSRAVPDQPRHMLRLSTSYSPSSTLPGLKLGASVRAQSNIYGIAWYGRPPTQEAAHLTQGGYVLLDLMTSYAFNNRLSLQLNLDNALDRKYYRAVGFYDNVYWGEPRNWTLTLRWAL